VEASPRGIALGIREENETYTTIKKNFENTKNFFKRIPYRVIMHKLTDDRNSPPSASKSIDAYSDQSTQNIRSIDNTQLKWEGFHRLCRIYVPELLDTPALS
jgi:hypothetical protein